MTVASETNLITAIANGSQTVFPYTFRALSSADLVVIGEEPSGAETYYTESTDYTVSGIGSYSGGNVTFVAAPANGTRITIRRAISAFTQNTDLRNQGAFFAETHEDVFDRLVMMLQTLKTDSQRSMRARVSDFAAGVSTDLPNAAGAQLLGWTADGTALTNYSAAELNASTFSTEKQVATAAQTVFNMLSLVYTPGTNNLAVYKNGLRLILGEDYTETTSTRVTLTAGATAGDELLFVGARELNDAIGAESVSFLQSGIGAVARSIQSKARDFKTFKDFGAVGDGVTNDTAAVLLALQSGFPVDGGGLTYGISGTMQPTSFKGLQNANFIQLTPTVASVATLYIYALSNWFIDNCRFDMGSTINSGAVDDSSKSALRVRNADGSYCQNFFISRVSVTGNGNGSRIQVRQSKRFTITDCNVRDCVAGFTPDPTDDIMNGFDIGDCANFTLSNCNAYNLRCVLAGVETYRFTRGFLFTEIRDCSIIGCNSTNNDQAFDFSGAVNASTPAYYQGNRRFTISGCTANNGWTWGFKFANVTHDGLITGCIANNCGSAGFVCSPGADTTVLPNAAYCTANLDFVGCKVVNVLGTGAAGAGNAVGFRTARSAVGSGYETYPRGIRFRNCEVIDTQAVPTTNSGFLNDVISVVYPSTDWNKNISNTAVGCSVGQGVTTPFNNIGPTLCSVTSSVVQSIPNSTWTDLAWDNNSYDNNGLHPTSTIIENILIKEPGTYRIFSRIRFALNGVGARIMRILINGNIMDRTTTTENPSASQDCTIATEIIRVLSSGDSVRIAVFQSSGGALNALTNEGLFTVNKID